MITAVYVDQARLAPTDHPKIVVDDGNSRRAAYEVEITGPSWLRYEPDQPHRSGAVMWLETTHEVRIIK